MSSLIILANVRAPYVAWGVGDDADLSLPFSMLATTFAAIVERPFYVAAGINTKSFRQSMRANILSWLIGVTIAYVSLILRMEFVFLLMYFLAIPFSIAIEGSYLNFVSRSIKDAKLDWFPIFVGNVFSGLLLLGIRSVGLEAGDYLQRSGSRLVLFLMQNKETIQWGVGIGCAVLFFYCCLIQFQANVANEIESDSESQVNVRAE
ncbi:MAG: hypothetical protein AAF623_09785 [Planctomycetota bacterium]